MRHLLYAGAVAAVGAVAAAVWLSRDTGSGAPPPGRIAAQAAGARSFAAVRNAPSKQGDGLPQVLPKDLLFGIDRARLEKVLTFTDDSGRSHEVYYGPTTDGKSCLFETIAVGLAAEGTPLGPQGGGCRPQGALGRRLRWSAHFDGDPAAPRSFYVYGLADPGVDRVAVVDARGAARDARMSSVTRGFVFQSSPGAAVAPAAIVAYDARGETLAHEQLGK